MFVEIAPKETGKIQRLIEDAIKYLNSHQNTIIHLVSYTESQSILIKNKILEEYKCDGSRITISKFMTRKKVSGSRVIKNYVYEFDLMRETVNNMKYLFIDDDAYYASSIGTYSDFTKRLITHFKKSYNRKKKIENIIGD